MCCYSALGLVWTVPQIQRPLGRGIWLPVSHAPSCIVTTNPSRTGLNPLNIRRKLCYSTSAAIARALFLYTYYLLRYINSFVKMGNSWNSHLFNGNSYNQMLFFYLEPVPSMFTALKSFSKQDCAIDLFARELIFCSCNGHCVHLSVLHQDGQQPSWKCHHKTSVFPGEYWGFRTCIM